MIHHLVASFVLAGAAAFLVFVAAVVLIILGRAAYEWKDVNDSDDSCYAG